MAKLGEAGEEEEELGEEMMWKLDGAWELGLPDPFITEQVRCQMFVYWGES